MMQRERQGRNILFNLDHPFRSFPGFANFPSIFGARDPFDDPFFTQPFRGFGGQDPFDDTFRPLGSIVDSGSNNGSRVDASNSGSTKGLIIEELNSDDETEFMATDASMTRDGQKSDERYRVVSSEPSVEHPENGDQEKKTVALNSRSDHDRAQRTHAQTKSVSVQTCKVTYGGVDGAYYTSSQTRSRGSDGVVLEESKEADRTTGQATHRISRGINDKGHSVTRKLNSDGKVDTAQTLHNLNEDELASFERSWAANGRGSVPSWNKGRDGQPHEGALERFGTSPLGSWGRSFVDGGRFRSDVPRSSGKKVVRINID